MSLEIEERYDRLWLLLLTDRPMGLLEKLPLLLYILLANVFCLTARTELAIAAAPPTLLFYQETQLYQETQRVSQTHLPDASRPSTLPIPGRKSPHFSLPTPRRLFVAPFPSFNSRQLDQQLQRYLRFLAKAGQPDILIVGSSRALQGIDPIVLQQTLAKRGYPNLKIFNFGINGATAQLVDWLLRQLLTPDQLPRLILWADGVRAFNSGRLDTTYNRAIASKGYQLLVSGQRLTLHPLELVPKEQPCIDFLLHRSAHEVKSQSKDFNFLSFFDAALQRRHLCWAPFKTLTQAEPTTQQESKTIAKLQDATGFQPRFDQFKPEQYFQRYPQVPGDYDADYRNFGLSGKQTEALNNVVNFANAHQIPIVFINLPLTQIYLDETRTLYEKQFRTYLQHYARSQKLSVHDFSQRWLYQNDYFMDPSHLNHYGASAVTAQIGKGLVLPKTRP